MLGIVYRTISAHILKTARLTRASGATVLDGAYLAIPRAVERFLVAATTAGSSAQGRIVMVLNWPALMKK